MAEPELARLEALLFPNERPLEPAEFRARLLVDCNGEAKCLGEILDPWQDEDFRALDPGWRRVAGLPPAPGETLYLKAYLERGKGHGKTTDQAVMVLYALYAAKRQIKGYGAAGDKDQAKLLRDAIDTIVRLNPWLESRITVNRYEISNKQTGSVCNIIASDEAGSHGYLPDFVIVDELTHWTRREFWEALFAGTGKRAHCMLVVISNAGMGRGISWQWGVRERFRTNPKAYFRRLDGPIASWITAEQLAEQRRELMPKTFARLWLNEWTSGTGDALDLNDIEACITRDGPQAAYSPECDLYLGGLDLGLTHDHAAFVVLGIQVARSKLRLCHCQSWDPKDFEGGKIKVSAVKASVLETSQRFGLTVIDYDPWQCELLAEELTAAGITMLGVVSSPKNLDEMAKEILQVFRNRMIDLYPDEPLLRDLMRLSIEERGHGYRMEAPRDEHGHCDKATALILAVRDGMSSLRELLGKPDEPERTSVSA